VRVQKGRLESTNPGQRYDNVRWKKDGKWLDKDGKEVPKKSEESHIPIEEFKFDKEVYK